MRTLPAARRLLFAAFTAAVVVTACRAPRSTDTLAAPIVAAVADAQVLGTDAHRDEVMTSRFCGACHSAIYAEHRQNTHGRAFFDEEARLATRGFRREDCIRCHTPRPVFETGIGMTPMTRWTDLEEGNTCMSCHGRAGYDYARFTGGAECKNAFEPTVGTVAHCATCHRIAGTPEQWSRAEHGKRSGRVCIDCHMPLVVRPVADGAPPRTVRSHLFPAASNEDQLRKAYAYDARIDGNAVVVRIDNRGVGHNFPTANRQRAVESLVIVRDRDGNEIARSRLVCRYPYASELVPQQLTLPLSSQIPSGKSTEHRVPLTIADGSVECRLYFKLYRPSADDDPHLARCLETRRLPFAGIAPSSEPVPAEVEHTNPAPPTELKDFLAVDGFANVLRPQLPAPPVVVPEGKDDAELVRLGAMLESHLPEVRKLARQRLAAAFPRSTAVLVRTLGHWSNESFREAQRTLLAIGTTAVPTLAQALDRDELYVRCHARDLLAQLDLGAQRDAVLAHLRSDLAAAHPLDRRSAAEALGAIVDHTAANALRERLADGDEDVVQAAATALASLDDRAAVPTIAQALQCARWPETRRALALALAGLGNGSGVQPLLRDLDQHDELARERTAEALFTITGRHFGYEPGAPLAERLAAQSRMQAWWSQHADTAHLQGAPHLDAPTREATWALVERLGGGSDTEPPGDDAAIAAELLAFGSDAVPALIEGLTFPTGFAQKRAAICDLLGRLGRPEAAPYLAAALRDPVPAVTEWACQALATCGDADVLAQLRNYQDRVPRLVGADRGAGADAPADRLLATAARTRLLLGDETARTDLVGLLLSSNAAARRAAIVTLTQKYHDDRGFDPDAAPADRLRAAARWQN